MTRRERTERRQLLESAARARQLAREKVSLAAWYARRADSPYLASCARREARRLLEAWAFYLGAAAFLAEEEAIP